MTLKVPEQPGHLGNISRSCKAIKPQVTVDAGDFPGCNNTPDTEGHGPIPVGASAGGMIAEAIAIEHPGRIGCRRP
jgi:hypothetical protein